MEDFKEGQIVVCKLVTGEEAVGIYSTQSPLTGSHLVKNVTTKNGMVADYAWAESIVSK